MHSLEIVVNITKRCTEDNTLKFCVDVSLFDAFFIPKYKLSRTQTREINFLSAPIDPFNILFLDLCKST